MKKTLSIILALVLAIGCLGLAGCGEKKSSNVVIGVPNDTTNEARALMLLEANGIIKLKEGVTITATIKDIVSKPENLEFKEIEAAQLPAVLKDLDYAVINGNYAIGAGLSPKNALLLEGSASAYGNVICVKEGNESAPLTKALVAAVSSKKVAEYISSTYADGSVVSVVDNPTNGFDSSVDYAALSGQKISVACSPSPHAEILAVAKDILAEKNITLVIKEYTDYVLPNNAVEDGEEDANFFAHVPYQDNFNKENGTHIVSVAQIHCEPMGLFGGKQSNLDALK